LVFSNKKIPTPIKHFATNNLKTNTALRFVDQTRKIKKNVTSRLTNAITNDLEKEINECLECHLLFSESSDMNPQNLAPRAKLFPVLSTNAGIRQRYKMCLRHLCKMGTTFPRSSPREQSSTKSSVDKTQTLEFGNTVVVDRVHR